MDSHWSQWLLKNRLFFCWHKDIVDKSLRLYPWWFDVKFTVNLFSQWEKKKTVTEKKGTKSFSALFSPFIRSQSTLPDMNKRNEANYCTQNRVEIFFLCKNCKFSDAYCSEPLFLFKSLWECSNIWRDFFLDTLVKNERKQLVFKKNCLFTMFSVVQCGCWDSSTTVFFRTTFKKCRFTLAYNVKVKNRTNFYTSLTKISLYRECFACRVNSSRNVKRKPFYKFHWNIAIFMLPTYLFSRFNTSTINPILYNVMSHRYRIAFRETLCSRKRGFYSSANGFVRDQSSFRETTIAAASRDHNLNYEGSQLVTNSEHLFETCQKLFCSHQL